MMDLRKGAENNYSPVNSFLTMWSEESWAPPHFFSFSVESKPSFRVKGTQTLFPCTLKGWGPEETQESRLFSECTISVKVTMMGTIIVSCRSRHISGNIANKNEKKRFSAFLAYLSHPSPGPCSRSHVSGTIPTPPIVFSSSIYCF